MHHPFARVLTFAAAGAVLCFGGAVAAQGVRIDIGLGTPSGPPVVLTTPPPLVVVPGTSVYYAPEGLVDYFRYHGRYYAVVHDVWSTTPAVGGPWARAPAEEAQGEVGGPPALLATRAATAPAWSGDPTSCQSPLHSRHG